MKWVTPVLPYLAVFIGIFWIQNAFLALLGFHVAILLSLRLGRSNLPLKVLFQSRDRKRMILSVLLCGSSGITLYFLWPHFGFVADLSTRMEASGLTRSIWPWFIAYFVLVNPLVEEYFWRGFLGNPTRSLSPSDFLYAGFHGMVLWEKVQTGALLYGLLVLIFAGWFWRQLAREDHGLLAPVLGHGAADFTILMAVYLMSAG